MNAHNPATSRSRNPNVAKQTSLVLVLLACTFTSCETLRNGLNTITSGARETSRVVDDTTSAVEGVQRSVESVKEVGR